MSKVAQLYTGASTRDGEVALSVGGAWYRRSYDFNGYRMEHSPWRRIPEPERPTHTAVSDDMAESYGAREQPLTEEQRAGVVYGPIGTRLRLNSGPCAYRLPDTQQEIDAREIAKACKGRKAIARHAGGRL